jgi:intein/homing endonuclease
MTWKKYFRVANLSGSVSPINGSSGNHFTYRNYQSNLPDVYIGHPNRIERYNQYEQMDMDSEVNAALDILSEFSTQINKENSSAFQFVWKEKPTDNEIKIIKEQLTQWVSLNELNKRIFKIFRNTIKYGDQVFIRDPETFKLFWVEMSKVVKVIVNEAEGKKPEQYIVKELAPNFENLTATALNSSDVSVNHPQVGGPNGAYIQPKSPYSGGSRFSKAQNEQAINAEHIVHLSLTEGLDFSWPFGNSVLENVFKVFKQKELLEDAIIIYRVQRAPERRIFYIDVGNMPSHMAMAFVERVKNEVHQRRIPTQTGGGQNMMDATYSPLSINEDYFFPQTADGRGSKVDTLAGGCLSMDTQVDLLDGRTLTLTELTEEYKLGKKNWTFSTNPETGEIVPGLISWAGVTHQSAKVLKIVLDNGKEIIATPDHKFPILGKESLRADQLKPGDRLIPFNKSNKNLGKYKKKEYTQIYQNNSKKWQFVHRMVADYEPLSELIKNFVFDNELNYDTKRVIHHLDFNRFNNNPENLVIMSWNDHKKLHEFYGFSVEDSKNGAKAAAEKIAEMKKNNPEEYTKWCKVVSDNTKKMWQNFTTEQKNDIKNSIRNGINRFLSELSDENIENRRKNSIDNFKKGSEKIIKLLQTDIEFRNKFTNSQKNGWKKFKNTEQYELRNKKIAEHSKNRMSNRAYRNKIYGNQKVVYDKELIDSVQKLMISNPKINLNQVLSYINSSSDLLNIFLTSNSNTKCANWNKEKMTESQLRNMPKRYGYKNWSHFKKEAELYNHTIVEIVELDEPIAVGTLTIDVDEIYHSYHNFALSVGVFTNNSNLGEITDLHFFTNKLFRGLRIPASYLPTGLDDGTSNPNTFSDGRVGTALIQEWRFNQYCIRLQRSIAEKLDQEFKMFMRWRGINIDGGLFELQFNEPQNFASYRQAEVDSARITSFTQLEAYPYLSKRFLMSRFLGLTEEEMSENEKLWEQEQGDAATSKPDAVGLRSVGISPGGLDMGIEAADMASVPPPEGGEGESAAGGAGPGGVVPPLPPSGPMTQAM